MTQQEELTYLFGIMSEASKWTRSSDDERDSVRMEVEERIQRLLGNGGEPDENGVIQSVVHPDKEEIVKPRAEKIADTVREKGLITAKEARRRYVQTHTRAWFDGKQSFYPNDQIADILLPNNRIKHVHKASKEYKQYLEAHPGVGTMTQVHPAFPPWGQSTPVDKLGDSLWAEHEKGDDNG